MAGRQNKEARTFGAPMGASKPTAGKRDYPEVGPADRRTRRQKMREQREASAEETRERAARTNEASKKVGEENKKRDHQTSGTKDVSAEGASRRLRGRDEQIDEAVEEAVEGADE